MTGKQFFGKALSIAGLVLACAAVIYMVLSLKAVAHDAPSGWSYPMSCCSGVDCREVPADWIDEKPEGYRVVPTGEVIPMTDRKIKPSPDGLYHWCSVASLIDGKTICLFVPSRSY